MQEKVLKSNLCKRMYLVIGEINSDFRIIKIEIK